MESHGVCLDIGYYATVIMMRKKIKLMLLFMRSQYKQSLNYYRN